jgi:hypothetical protein
MRLSFALICLTVVAYAQSSAPAITSASPNPIDAGGPAFTLTVKVGAFVPGAVVKWSGTPLANTTFVDGNTLSVTVPASLIAICGKYLLTVTNNQNNSVSNSYPVIVNPVLNSISPNLLPAGSGGTTVTASGLGFSSNVYLTLNASGSRTNLATNYGGPTTLTAFVPASALNGIYPAVSLFVADPTTGAVSQTLPITLTFATVTAVFQGLYPTQSPDTIYADIASYSSATSFPLVVQGANFVPGAQVLWNGTPLATVYNASNFLIGTVPADLVHNASADGKSPPQSVWNHHHQPHPPIGGCRRPWFDSDRHRRALRSGLHRPMVPHPAPHHLRQCHPVDRHRTGRPGRHRKRSRDHRVHSGRRLVKFRQFPHHCRLPHHRP